jgi:FAD-linked oxidoreductase
MTLRTSTPATDRARTKMGGRTDESGIWRNWTGDQSCRPAAFVRPRDKEELIHALTNAREEGRNARVVGAGHSFTDGVLTNGLLISLDRMNKVIDIDGSARSVRVEGGITLHDLNEALAENDLALENLGDIDVQSISGATATGTHGTGGRFRNLSANIESIELVLADGSQVEVNEGSDADAWRAARVSLGALGVVTAMTLKAFPAFTLKGVDATASLDEVLAKLEELVDENDHFEFYAFPHSRTVMTRTNNRVDEEPRPRSRASEWMHDILLVNHMFNAVCRFGRRFPSSIPRLNRLSARLSGGSERVDRSYRIFSSPRLVRFTESEYAIPREHVETALRSVLDVVESGGYDVPFPFEVRFVAPDDAFLSPAFGRDTAYIAVHQFEKMEWEPFFRSVQSVMDELEGRPHWGKRHFQKAETLAPRYPKWKDFQSVRARFDPQGLFANDHATRVLGSRTSLGR